MATERAIKPQADEDATEPSRKACEFRLRADGIYEVTFHERSTRAIDELFEALDENFSDVSPHVVVRILVNSSKSGVQPLPYSFRRVREWMLHVNVYPPTRLAFVHNNHNLMMVVDRFLRALYTRHMTIRLFSTDQYDEAIAWLLNHR